MLKFFRKIRQQLISENLPDRQAGNFSKYLLYAIGEILLVMVGILLALQVNNWNEANKIKKVELNYLKSLNYQFRQNLLELNTVDSLIKMQLGAAREMLKHTGPNASIANDSLFTILYHNSFKDFHQFLPSSGAIDEITNTGNLSIFSNTDLRDFLASWKSKMAMVKEQEVESRNTLDQTQNFMRDYGNFRTQIHKTSSALNLGKTKFNTKNSQLLSDEKFENHIALFIGINNNLLENHYQTIRKEIESVIIIIDGELRSRI